MTTTIERPPNAQTAHASWPLWSTFAEVVVIDPDTIEEAANLLDAYLREVELATSRFRADSEIRRLPPVVSDLLARHLDAALWAAGLTEGRLDLTVGTALRELGYDRDLDLIGLDGDCPVAVVGPVPGWRRVRLLGNRLEVPASVELDLGATTKALAADEGAALINRRLGTGVLVNLGGDLATGGPAPEGGWSVRVEADGAPPVEVSIQAGAALATSSTRRRRWTLGGAEWHHLIDPATGGSVSPVWQAVSVSAQTCLGANVASTAAIVMGESGLGWLQDRGLPARLVHADGSVRRTGGWPEDAQ